VLPAVFWYWYFAGIRFAGFSVFRSVSFPPFSLLTPLFSPLFFKKGVELLKKGATAPLLRKKGATAPFLVPKCTDRVFLWYGIGNTGEISTEYRPKIPNWYTTLVKSGLQKSLFWSHAGSCTVSSFVHSYQVQKTCLRINYFRFLPQPWRRAALAPTIVVCGVSMPQVSE